jgi:hypothetical protein
VVSLVGCDINQDCINLEYVDPRIQIVIGDINDDETTSKILSHVDNGFSVILDDGSHTSKDIIKSFIKYFSLLNEGGIYIIEDLHCSYWESYEGGLHHPFSSISFFKKLIDIINFEHWRISKSPSEYLSGIFEHYNISNLEDCLSQVQSVEFINSICIVRKKKLATSGKLGTRILAGKINIVLKSDEQLDDRSSIRLINQIRTNSNLSLPLSLDQSENY